MTHLHQRFALLINRHDIRAPSMDELLAGYLRHRCVVSLYFSLFNETIKHGPEQAIQSKYNCQNVIKDIFKKYGAVSTMDDAYLFDDAESATAAAIEAAEAINSTKSVKGTDHNAKTALRGFGLHVGDVMILPDTNFCFGLPISESMQLAKRAEFEHVGANCSPKIGGNGIGVLISASVHQEIFEKGTWLIARVDIKKIDKGCYGVHRKRSWKVSLAPHDYGKDPYEHVSDEKNMWKSWTTRIWCESKPCVAVVVLQLCDPDGSEYNNAAGDADSEKSIHVPDNDIDGNNNDDEEDLLRTAAYKKLERGPTHCASIDVRFRQLVVPVFENYNTLFQKCEGGTITAVFDSVPSALNAASSARLVINRQNEALLHYHKPRWSVPLAGIGIDCSFGTGCELVATDMEHCLHGVAVYGSMKNARIASKMFSVAMKQNSTKEGSNVVNDLRQTCKLNNLSSKQKETPPVLVRPVTGRKMKALVRMQKSDVESIQSNSIESSNGPFPKRRIVSRFGRKKTIELLSQEVATKLIKEPPILVTHRVKEFLQQNIEQKIDKTHNNIEWVKTLAIRSSEKYYGPSNPEEDDVKKGDENRIYLVQGETNCKENVAKMSDLDHISLKLKIFCRRYKSGSTKLLSASKAVGINSPKSKKMKQKNENDVAIEKQKEKIIEAKKKKARKEKKRSIEEAKTFRERNRINVKDGDLVLLDQLIRLQNTRTFAVIAFHLDITKMKEKSNPIGSLLDSLKMKYISSAGIPRIRKSFVRHHGIPVGISYPVLCGAFMFGNMSDALAAMRGAAQTMQSQKEIKLNQVIRGFGISFGDVVACHEGKPDLSWGGAVQEAHELASAAASERLRSEEVIREIERQATSNNVNQCNTTTKHITPTELSFPSASFILTSEAAYADIVDSHNPPPPMSLRSVNCGLTFVRKKKVYLMELGAFDHYDTPHHNKSRNKRRRHRKFSASRHDEVSSNDSTSNDIEKDLIKHSKAGAVTMGKNRSAHVSFHYRFHFCFF